MIKPLLAATVESIHALRYPLLASHKLDGIRALVMNGCVMSRSMKPIPNMHVQDLFGKLNYFDGELIVGPANANDVYRQTSSGVMSRDGTPKVVYHVFDHLWLLNDHYYRRFAEVYAPDDLPVEIVMQELVANPEELLDFEAESINLGYEGVMLRDPNGRYKQGRSTLNESILLKLKRFADDEGVCVGFEELMHNANEAKLNELGYTERSSHKANQVPTGRLGSLIVEWRERVFHIGTGFTDAQREEIWANRTKYEHQLVKFKYLPVGVKDLPRHPVFMGWRSAIDR